jgi:hypothetical protein
MWTERVASPGIRKPFTEASFKLNFNYIHSAMNNFSICLYIYIYIWFGGQGNENKNILRFISGLNTRLAKMFSADRHTEHHSADTLNIIQQTDTLNIIQQTDTLNIIQQPDNKLNIILSI